ncbi:MAG: TlpA family protein disulfide reductase [Deltaproteobacteria bacterium]|nr:TlpA family protein disulfide reductase [Deltaproteobacteria bacterium]
MRVRRSITKSRAWGLALLGVPLFVACSDAGARGPVTLNPKGCAAVDAGAPYPPCPYGINEGEAIENATFVGRRGGLDTPRENIDLASYHAMRARGSRYLVLNVAAFWCSPCKEEAREMQAHIVPAYAPRGVAFLSVVLQDESRRPATDDKVDTWIRAFRLTFPVVRDPDAYVTRFFDPASMPLNMIIDLETMKIEQKVIGADLRRVTSTLDTLLSKPPLGAPSSGG